MVAAQSESGAYGRKTRQTLVVGTHGYSGNSVGDAFATIKNPCWSWRRIGKQRLGQQTQKNFPVAQKVTPNGGGFARISLLFNQQLHLSRSPFFPFNQLLNGRKVGDRKSTRLNSSHVRISYAVF